MPRLRPRPVVAVVVSFALIVALIVANRWLFRNAFGDDYFLWYLRSGTLISVAAGVLGLVWVDAKSRRGLISQHPAVYLAACLQLIGVFLFSLSPTRRGQKSRPAAAADFDIGLDSPLAGGLDEFLYGLLALVMLLLSLGWLLVVAPLAYFVNLVAGVPARQGLRGRLVETRVREQEGQVMLSEPGGEADRRAGDHAAGQVSGLSFARDPFAVTQATAAVILWLGSVVYERLV